ncbi:hypothetical protein OpiT1DRAFT_00900 [Opitutaceae bacterium TAV1]|nr:hypothetical protein OpiT1DRAFT_00900 [Opitutaceae bacterium TAV1]
MNEKKSSKIYKKYRQKNLTNYRHFASFFTDKPTRQTQPYRESIKIS